MTKKHLTEEQHAETKPTGAVIAWGAVLIALLALSLFGLRYCYPHPEPAIVPFIYPDTVTQPIIPPLAVIPKPVHKYHPSPSIPCKIGIDCGCIQVKDGVKGRCE